MSEHRGLLPHGSATPLPDRMVAFLAFRAGAVTLVIGLGELRGVPASPTVLASAVAYLAFGLGLTLLCRIPSRPLRTAASATAVLTDAVYLQHQHARLGTEVPVDLVIAAFLVAACLLVSFRTGLVVAALQSLLFVASVNAQEAGALPVAPGGVPDDTRLVAELVTLWLVVITTGAAASVHQRELKRRRSDADALRRFASALHQDTTPEAVAVRILRFGTDDLRGRRGAVVRQRRQGLELAAAHRTALDPHTAEGEVSSALTLAALSREPSIVRGLDPLRDAWLHAVMPAARRVVLVRLDIGLADRMWLVLEPPSGRGRRVERRFVGALSQAAGLTSLALARVQLLTEATLRASQDALTGVPNRRTLDELLQRLTAGHQRSGAGFSVVMVDVDHFKSINDTYGHLVGDEVLQQVAVTLRAQLRKNETIARYGGEEFAVVLPGTATPAAVAVAERLRRALHSITRPVAVTASFGVASVPDDADDGVGATALADAALMHAKQGGRDRVAATGFTGAGAGGE